MKGLILCSFLFCGVFSEEFHSNQSIIEINSDYFRDTFLENVVKLPNILKLNACQRQMLYISKNWKKRNIFPCKFNILKYIILLRYNLKCSIHGLRFLQEL